MSQPSGECVYGGLESVRLASQLSLHTAGGHGVLTTENKYSSTQTTDICYQRDKSFSRLLCDPGLADRAARQTALLVSHELLQSRLIFVPSDSTSDLCSM